MPHHGLQCWMIIPSFYNSVTQPMRLSIDAAAGGTLMSKTEDEAYNLIEEMTLNNLKGPLNEPNSSELEVSLKLMKLLYFLLK